MAFEPLVVPSRLNRPDQFAEEAELCLNGVADFIEKYNELSSVLNGAITSTSTTSLTIGTGTKSPVVQPGLNLVPGYPIRLAYRVDPTKYMDGVVLTYDIVTGALSSDISSPTGSGTYADWQVMVLAAPEPSPVAGPTHAASSKSIPVDADEIPLIDSAASFSLKRLTWANLKAALKTYFDTVYTYVTAAVDTTFSSTADNAAATPAWVKGLTKFTKEYVSSDQVYTASGSLMLAHGLGTKPKSIQVWLKCTTANLNYSVGDEFPFLGMTDGDGSFGNVSVPFIIPDATNLNIGFGSGPLMITDKSTRSRASATISSWRVIFKAWA